MQRSTIRPMTLEQEQALGRRARAGDVTARDALVTQYIPLVLRIVGRIGLRNGPDHDDAIQHGLIGLVEAADRYDPDAHPGIKFGTYAGWWVKKGLQDWRESRWIVRTPRYLTNPPPGRTPKDEYLAAAARARQPLSELDGLDQSGLSWAADPGADRAEAEAIRAEESESLRAALAQLNARTRTVIERRAGLGDGVVHSLEDVGREVSVGRERVRQVEAFGLRRLAAILGADPARADSLAGTKH